MVLQLVTKNGKRVSAPYIEAPIHPPSWGTLVCVNGLGGGPKEAQHFAVLQKREKGVSLVYGLSDRSFYTVDTCRIRTATFSDPENRKRILELLRYGLVGHDCIEFKAAGEKLRTIMDVWGHKERWKLLLRNPRGGREYEASLDGVELVR